MSLSGSRNSSGNTDGDLIFCQCFRMIMQSKLVQGLKTYHIAREKLSTEFSTTSAGGGIAADETHLLCSKHKERLEEGDSGVTRGNNN